MRVKEPQTDEEWQEVALLAGAVRLIYDCMLYGLVTGGPEIDIARCDDLIARARLRGIEPTREDVLHIAVRIVQQVNGGNFEGI